VRIFPKSLLGVCWFLFYVTPWFYWSCSDSVGDVYDVQQADSSSVEYSSSKISSVSVISSSSQWGDSSSSSLSEFSSDLTPIDLADLELIWSQFPQRQVSPDEEFWLKWKWNIPAEQIPGDVTVYYQKLDSDYNLSMDSWTILHTLTATDSVLMDFTPFENNDRIRLLIEYEDQDVEGQVLRDMTSYFDIHDGKTSYTYDANIQVFFQSYCTQCHGSAGGLSLTSYGSISQGNTPLYIMNRVNFIGDMPSSGSPAPSEAERAMLRDWILAGFPKN
jgi:hypothetical protein